MGQIRKSLGAVLASAALLFLSVEIHAQATDVDCEECVDASDIAAGSIKNNKIAKFAVQSDKIAKQAVTSPKIAPAAVTTGKIANGAVTVDKLSPELSNDIGKVPALENEVSVLQGEQAVQNDRLTSLETKRELLDQNELGSIWSNMLNAHFDLRKIGNDLYSCGQLELYGCSQATSANGDVFPLTYRPRTESLYLFDPVTSKWATAVTSDIYGGFATLRFVGEANVLAHRNVGQMLVNDCDNPTTGYIQHSRNPYRTGPQGDLLIPLTVMNNSGHLYEIASVDSIDVDVSGNTFGVMNFIVHSDNVTPICTPGVSNRTGIWQQYNYTFVLDLNQTRFVGPFTYQGSSIGLLDRVEALENP